MLPLHGIIMIVVLASVLNGRYSMNVIQGQYKKTIMGVELGSFNGGRSAAVERWTMIHVIQVSSNGRH